MKKIVALLLLAFATLHVHAQEFHVIPKIGLNFANMTGIGGSMKPGMNIGVSGEWMVTHNVAFEPGLYFSMQGSKESKGGMTAKLNTNYINIPLLAKAYVYDGFHVFAGPQIGINASTKAKVKSSGVSISADADKMMKTMNLDLILGIGYQLDMGLLLSLNYNVGLTNVLNQDYRDDYGTSFKGEKSRHSVVQLNVGWRF